MTRRAFLRLLGIGAIASPSLLRSRSPAAPKRYGDYSAGAVRRPRDPVPSPAPYMFRLDPSCREYIPTRYEPHGFGNLFH